MYTFYRCDIRHFTSISNSILQLLVTVFSKLLFLLKTFIIIIIIITDHVVSKYKILDLVFSDPLYDNLYVKLDEPKRWRLDFFLNPPQDGLK
jgi:hypothetical protein